MPRSRVQPGDGRILTPVVLTHAGLPAPVTMDMVADTGASISLQAKAATQPIDLASAGADLSVVSRTNVGLEVLATPGLVPLFTLSKVQPKDFMDWLLRRRSFKPLFLLTVPGAAVPEVPGTVLQTATTGIDPSAAADLGQTVEETYHFALLP